MQKVYKMHKNDVTNGNLWMEETYSYEVFEGKSIFFFGVYQPWYD